MAGSATIRCSRCGNNTGINGDLLTELEYRDEVKTFVCSLCEMLGPRSLVVLLKTPRNTPEFEQSLAAFRASPPGSVLFDEAIKARKDKARRRVQLMEATTAAALREGVRGVVKEGA